LLVPHLDRRGRGSRMLIASELVVSGRRSGPGAWSGCDKRRRSDYGRGVPPNFQRMLPFVVLAVLALFVLPQLFKRHSSGPSSSTRAAQTIDATNLVDKGEQSYRAAHGRFTPHLADLLPINTRLATDLAIGLSVQLDVSTKGQSFLAEVASNVLSLVRARSGGKISAQSCLVLKSGSGVKCPPPAT